MRCLQLNSSLLPMHAKLKPQQHITKLLWPTSRTSIPQSLSHHFPSQRTKALPHAIVVAATSPPNSGDLSAFLPVGALLLSVYLIANFIVPEFLTKAFGFDKLNEDQKADE